MLPWVVLGAAAGKRVRGLAAAAHACGVPVATVEWRDWLADPGALGRRLQQPCRLKLEPPGDDADAHLALLHLGCARLGRPPCEPPAHGELLAADAWFEGFRAALARLAAQVAALPHVELVNAPDEIVAMTDKLECQRRLQTAGVPTPALLGPVSGHDDLVARLDQHGLDRVFVKARYGSSAAGVIAYRRNGRGLEQATTTASLQPDGRLFNVKRPRIYTDRAALRRLVDAVAAQGAYAEVWMPKPRCDAGHFDLRVLTLRGRAAHRVARIGSRTVTNLHLDSARGDAAALLDAADLAALERTAEAAARAFPRSAVIGFDAIARRGAAAVLEANAFGDLLPGLLWNGRDTYAAAFEAFEAFDAPRMAT